MRVYFSEGAAAGCTCEYCPKDLEKNRRAGRPNYAARALVYTIHMIIQTANIVSGFLLAAPRIKEWGAKEHIEKAESALNKFRGAIGLVELVLGFLALIERLGFVYFFIPSFGSSFPQAIPAIAIGAILSAHLFERFPAVHNIIAELKAYEIWIGIVGILVGLGSLL